MATFEKAILKVLRNEGGYVNDTSVPGGETYDGVLDAAKVAAEGK